MERDYKVFISYRHLPYDMKVAKKLHTFIEHYVVPKAYRKDENKKLGLVFRDKDELPITSSLSENLRIALDHSEFLVVVCSKETCKSRWVLEEVAYFIETHDRDHVLIFLIDGSMEESVPPQLMNLYDEDGNVIRELEPLAANIVADDEKKSMKLFNVEVLRIMAAIIGCPFDALYRREQRYKMRRAMSIASVVCVIAVGFVGLLWNRNIQIQEQLNQTYIKDSEANVALSDAAYEDREYTNAINYALAALPEKDEEPYERPYVPAAEKALAEKLNLYDYDLYGWGHSFQQDTQIRELSLCSDGKHLVTGDDAGSVYIWEVESGRLLWKKTFAKGYCKRVCFNETGNRILTEHYSQVRCFDVETGKEYWNKDDLSDIYMFENNDYWISKGQGTIELRTSENGEVIMQHAIPNAGKKGYLSLEDPVFSGDKSHVLFTICRFKIGKENKTERNYIIYDWDITENKIFAVTKRDLYDELLYMKYMYIGNDQIVTVEEKERYTFAVILYKKEKEAYSKKTAFSLKEKEFFSLNKPFMDADEKYIYIVSYNHIYIIDWKKKEYDTTYMTLPDNAVTAQLLKDHTLAVLCKNGQFLMASNNERTASGWASRFGCGFTVQKASIVGDDYDQIVVSAVPFDGNGLITTFHWLGDHGLSFRVPLASEDVDSGCSTFSSPDGKTVVLLKDEFERKEYAGTVLTENRKTKAFRISHKDIEDIHSDDDGYVIDENRMILGMYILNFDKQTITKMECENKYGLAITTLSESNHILMAEKQDQDNQPGVRWIEDGKKTTFTPFEGTLENGEKVLSVHPHILGHNGYLFCKCFVVGSKKTDGTGNYYDKLYVYDRNTDQWSLCEIEDIDTDDLYDSIIEMAEEKPLLAYVTLDRSIKIYDLSGEKETIQITDFTEADITKLLFVDEDRYLIAFHDSGNIQIFDAQTGRLIKKNTDNGKDLTFDRYRDYKVFFNEEQNRMIIIVGNGIGSDCVVLDCNTKEIVACYKGITHYFKETGNVLSIKNKLGVEEAAIFPFYSFSEIKAKGREIVGEFFDKMQ